MDGFSGSVRIARHEARKKRETANLVSLVNWYEVEMVADGRMWATTESLRKMVRKGNR